MSTILNASIIWLGIIFFPCFIAGLFAFKNIRAFLVKIVPWAAFPALLASILVDPGEGVKIFWFFFDSMFVLDQTGKVFLFFTSILWFLAGFYSISYIQKPSGKIRYFVCYLLAMSGNIGLILAQDVFSFYFLFALMSFSSYGLVAHEQNAESAYASKIYLILVVIGEAFVFSGLLMLVHSTGTIYIAESLKLLVSEPECRTVILFMFIGFGIKAGALPMHVWLPLAHPIAPTPASAVLSGAMIKAGLLGWLRFLPLGAAGFLDLGYVIIIMGIAAAIYGALVGLTQNKIKSVLAYSSISQMGMMTIIVGMGLLKPELWTKCWTVLMFYALHHALAKGALFLSVGTAVYKIKSSWLRCLRDVAIIWPAAAVIGVPFSSGELAKGSLKILLKKSGSALPHMDIVGVLVAVSAVTTALIMARFLWLIWQLREKSQEPLSKVSGLLMPWMIVVALVISLPACLSFGNIFSLGLTEISVKTQIKDLWPIGFAGVLFLSVVFLRISNPVNIKQGDVLYFYAQAAKGFYGMAVVLKAFLDKNRENSAKRWRALRNQMAGLSKSIDSIMDFFSTWQTFGVLFLGLCVALLILLG